MKKTTLTNSEPHHKDITKPQPLVSEQKKNAIGANKEKSTTNIETKKNTDKSSSNTLKIGLLSGAGAFILATGATSGCAILRNCCTKRQEKIDDNGQSPPHSEQEGSSSTQQSSYANRQCRVHKHTRRGRVNRHKTRNKSHQTHTQSANTQSHYQWGSTSIHQSTESYDTHTFFNLANIEGYITTDDRTLDNILLCFNKCGCVGFLQYSKNTIPKVVRTPKIKTPAFLFYLDTHTTSGKVNQDSRTHLQNLSITELESYFQGTERKVIIIFGNRIFVRNGKYMKADPYTPIYDDLNTIICKPARVDITMLGLHQIQGPPLQEENRFLISSGEELFS